MPSDYTHLHFGKKAIHLLPDTLRRAAQNHKDLYEIGLQGPDILFFYQPLKKCEVNQTGYAMHEVSAKEFFYPAREILENASDRDAALSYLAGFLGHYSLDHTCHGYIENKMRVSGLTHGEVEKEFDRYLMVLDQKAGQELDSAASIVASKKNAAVIADFFPTVSEDLILKALKSMHFLTDMLSGKGIRRPIVNAALKLSGQYEKMHDMLRPKELISGSEDSDLRLMKLMDKALQFYEAAAKDFEAFLEGGDFPHALEFTFAAGEGWMEIPVLTLKEEETYEV